jgi:hypothetical protein
VRSKWRLLSCNPAQSNPHTAWLVLAITRKTLPIVGDERVFEIPLGYSERLHQFLAKKLGTD